MFLRANTQIIKRKVTDMDTQFDLKPPFGAQ